MTPARRDFLAVAAGALLAVIVLGPALAPGYVLIRDMVFVPRWPLVPELLGLGEALPRAVPSDLVVALASHVLPGHGVQSLVLGGAFTAGVWGVARLLPDEVPWPGRLAGAAYYGWNAWLFERLLLGHWPLVVAFAALPWAVGWALRARREREPLRVPASVAVAGLTGAAGLALVLPTTLLIVSWPDRDGATRGRRQRPAALLLATTALVSLPWAVPTLLRPGGVPVREAGFELFAARADTPFGTVGSLLSLGGAWNALAAPPGRMDTFPAALALMVAVVGLAGLLLLARDGHRTLAAALAVAAATSLVAVTALATPAGIAVAERAIETVPALGVLRDAQKFVAPLALAEAVGFATLLGRVFARGRTSGSALVVAVTLGLLPIATLPAMAWGLGGRLESVDYPDSWHESRTAMAEDPVAGDVLVLPWKLYQRLPFNPDHVVLAPAQRFFPRDAIVSDDLLVGDRVLPGERQAAVAADTVVRSGEPLLPRMHELGIRYVFVARPDAATDRQLEGLETVVADDEARLLRAESVTGGNRGESSIGAPTVPVVLGDLTAVLGIVALFVLTRRDRRSDVSWRR